MKVLHIVSKKKDGGMNNQLVENGPLHVQSNNVSQP